MAHPELFRPPPLRAAVGDDGWRTETLTYRATARRKRKFKGALSAQHFFGAGGGQSVVTTKLSEAAYQLEVVHDLAGTTLTERLDAQVAGGRLRATELLRQLGDVSPGADRGALARDERVRFVPEPLGLPLASYPDVMLPFLMRGQPLDGRSRSVWSYTNDRFVARVYYEKRKIVQMQVPAGRFETALIWMYPDLNDWIALGGVITRLAKPLLPRYDIWIETGPMRRVIRFEGPYGPPGAPEIVLELMS